MQYVVLAKKSRILWIFVTDVNLCALVQGRSMSHLSGDPAGCLVIWKASNRRQRCGNSKYNSWCCDWEGVDATSYGIATLWDDE